MMTGGGNKAFVTRRGPNRVPQFRSVRYNDIVRGKDPSADTRLAAYNVVFVPPCGAAEYHWSDEYDQQYAPLNWSPSYVVNPGASTVIPSGAAAASH